MSVYEFVTGVWTWHQLFWQLSTVVVLGVGGYMAGYNRGWNRGHQHAMSICTTRSK